MSTVLETSILEKRREAQRQYYARHRQECIQRARNYRKTHKAKPRDRRAYQRSVYAKNPQKFLEKNRRWAENNKEKIREAHRNWARNNPELHAAQRRRFNVTHPEYSSMWAKKNPEKVKPSRQKAARKWKYGITADDFAALLSRQAHQCQGCFCPVDSSSCLDHDHACCPGAKSCGNCIRGILCRPCNMVLGAVKDNETTLANLIAYLRRSPDEERPLWR